MGVSKYEVIMNGDARAVGPKGEMTLPKEWRDEHGVEAGDRVAVHETEDGRLEVLPPEE